MFVSNDELGLPANASQEERNKALLRECNRLNPGEPSDPVKNYLALTLCFGPNAVTPEEFAHLVADGWFDEQGRRLKDPEAIDYTLPQYQRT
jgi:hypothetical protein